MRIWNLVWANLRHKKGRAVFLLLTVAFSVATFTAMLTVSRAMSEEIGLAFDQIGANVVVLPKSARRFGYSGVSLPPRSGEGRFLPAESVGLVRTIHNRESIAIVAPKLLAAVTTEAGPALAVGVHFPAEMSLRKWWQIRVSRAGETQQYAPARGGLSVGAGEALLGSRAAARLARDLGDQLVLNGRAFRVAGVMAPVGTDEDEAIWLDLGTLQDLSGLPGKVSLIEVAALCNTCPITEIVAQLSEKLPGARVSALKSAVAARQAVVDRFGRFAQALSVASSILGGLAVTLVMLGSVRERTREIGILRALGFRRRHVLAVFYLEAAVLGLLGGFAGSLAGSGLAGVLGPAVAGMTSGTPLHPLLVAGAAAAGAALAMSLACTLPAVHAARMDPVRALRFL